MSKNPASPATGRRVPARPRCCAKKEARRPGRRPRPPRRARRRLREPCELNVFIWSEYIDPEIVTDFEKEFSCKVTDRPLRGQRER